MTLTESDIVRCMSPNGGVKLEVVRFLGENATQMGWKRRLLGKKILRRDYEMARTVSMLPRLKNVPCGDAPGQTSLFT